MASRVTYINPKTGKQETKTIERGETARSTAAKASGRTGSRTTRYIDPKTGQKTKEVTIKYDKEGRALSGTQTTYTYTGGSSSKTSSKEPVIDTANMSSATNEAIKAASQPELTSKQQSYVDLATTKPEVKTTTQKFIEGAYGVAQAYNPVTAVNKVVGGVYKGFEKAVTAIQPKETQDFLKTEAASKAISAGLEAEQQAISERGSFARLFGEIKEGDIKGVAKEVKGLGSEFIGSVSVATRDPTVLKGLAPLPTYAYEKLTGNKLQDSKTEYLRAAKAELESQGISVGQAEIRGLVAGRAARAGAETAIIGATGAAAEGIGAARLASAFSKTTARGIAAGQVGRLSAGTVFKSLLVPGAVEGGVITVSERQLVGQKASGADIAIGATTGALVAGTAGVGLVKAGTAATKVGKSAGKTYESALDIADPTEKFTDVIFDFASSTAAKLGKKTTPKAVFVPRTRAGVVTYSFGVESTPVTKTTTKMQANKVISTQPKTTTKLQPNTFSTTRTKTTTKLQPSSVVSTKKESFSVRNRAEAFARPESKPDTKDESKSEIDSKPKPEPKTDPFAKQEVFIKTETKTEVKPTTETQTESFVSSFIKAETRPEIRPNVPVAVTTYRQGAVPPFLPSGSGRDFGTARAGRSRTVVGTGVSLTKIARGGKELKAEEQRIKKLKLRRY